jgi:hypothetical protein
MYIVVETCRDNDCNVSSFVEAYGPFNTLEEAATRAKELNSRGHWATSYYPQSVANWHWSDPHSEA